MVKQNVVMPALGYDSCCRIILANTRDPYAKAYANAGIGMRGEERRVQCLYILTNLALWRGDEAREVKAALKFYSKQKETA